MNGKVIYVDFSSKKKLKRMNFIRLILTNIKRWFSNKVLSKHDNVYGYNFKKTM